MTLAVCAKDLKFYQWPYITSLGTHPNPTESATAKTISWNCDGDQILVVRNKGHPGIVHAPFRSDKQSETRIFVPVNQVSTGTFSSTNPGLLAFGLESGDILLHDQSNKSNIKYKKLPKSVQVLDFSSDDFCLAAGCVDGQIYIYDSKPKPCASFLVPNCRALSTAVFSKYTSNLLAGASKDGVLCVWDTATTDSVFHEKSHAARITDLTFLEHTITTVGSDGYLGIYDLRSHGTAGGKHNLEGALTSLAYFPNSTEVAISTYHQLRSYDTRNLTTPVRTFLIPNNGNIKKIEFSNRIAGISPTVCASKSHGARFKNCDEGISASGDYSLSSPSIAQRSALEPKADVSRSSSAELVTSSPEVAHLLKELEETLRTHSTQFSEKLTQAFYGLRINTSKQFINLEERIGQSWNNFVEYLKVTGAASLSEKASSTTYKDVSNRMCGDKSSAP